MSQRPLVVIGLDAADERRLMALMESGRLPALARLRARGRMLPVRPEWPGVATEPWGSFVRRRPLAAHGQFFLKLWDPGRAAPRTLGPGERWLREGFWLDAAAAGARVAVIDVPFALPAPEVATHIAGWQVHYRRGRRGVELHGVDFRLPDSSVGLGPEPYASVDDRTIVRLAACCREATRGVADVVEHLLRDVPVDLLVVVFGALHDAGHYLQAPEALALADMVSTGTAADLAGELDSLYAEVDAAVGRVVEACPQARFVVFSLHGMGPETPWTTLLTRILSFAENRELSSRGLLACLRGSRLGTRLGNIVPPMVGQVLSRLAWRRMHDWSRIRIFPIPSEGIGALRLNLQGREPYGTVRPGVDARTVLEHTAEMLLRLRELGSDRPIAETVLMVDDAVPAGAPGRSTLPDLVIRWTELPWWECRGIRTPDGRTWVFDGVPVVPSGRTGNHRPGGFALVTGVGPEDPEPPPDPDPVELAAWLARLAPRP